MARPTLEARVAALRTAVDAVSGRLAPELVDGARAVLQRAEERVQLSAEHTVVALAGATGAGKSTLFNRLVGHEIARTGQQRPTTAFPMAVVAETAEIASGSAALLEWLGVGERHELPVSKQHPNGLMLLDLPDHDSVVTEHRMRADRVTERADLLVWVTNPQKYADGLLHNEYLAGLQGRDDSVVVVLNQIDRLDTGSGRDVVADLTRLVRRDGLDAKVLGASAITGQGVDEVQQLVTRAVTKRKAATERLTAEVRSAATALLAALPASADSRSELKTARAALLAALDDAAGVPLVVEAVRGASMRDAIVRTGWPPLRWIRALRADPLRVLGLRADKPSKVQQRTEQAPTGELVRTSLPTASPAVKARISSATRAYVAAASSTLPPRANEGLNARAVSAAEGIADDLDRAVARTVQLRPAAWWRAVDLLQWLLLVAAVAGGLWLALLAVLDYLRVPTDEFVPLVELGDFALPWPTALLIGGIVAGLLLALISRALAGFGARRRAARAQRELRSGVESVAIAKILGEVDAELQTLKTARESAAVAAA